MGAGKNFIKTTQETSLSSKQSRQKEKNKKKNVSTVEKKKLWGATPHSGVGTKGWPWSIKRANEERT